VGVEVSGLRVLVTHERFLPDFAGGCEYGVYSLSRGLESRGAQVRVLTTGNPAQKEYRGLETLRLPIHRYRMNLAAKQIAEQARDVDLIQTANYHAALPSFLAGRRLNKPVVLLVTALCGDAWLEMRGPVAGRVYSAWERFLMRRPFSRVVFPSQHALQLGRRMGIPDKRCVLIPPGIEHHKFGPDPDRPLRSNVLFVGKFERRKGIYDVLETARALPDIPFRLLGWGPEEQNLCQAAPPNVTIEIVPPGGVMDNSDTRLPEAFAGASIFFLPSRAESFGLVLVEAMASGCAIVSSVPLEFEGVRVRPGEIGSMVDAIRRLWADPQGMARIGQRNIQRASVHNWDRFTSALVETYEQILGRQLCREECHA
jgi:glycosyltransferase involved in cell wall biosynthesis